VDLSGRNKYCSPVPDSPVSSTTGAYIDGKALICGGFKTGVGAISDCYHLNNGSSEWVIDEASLSTGVHTPSSVTLSETEWWVSGGRGVNSQSVKSSELYTVGEGFSQYGELPLQQSYHYMLKIDDSKVMMLTNFGEPWLFNTNSRIWINMTNLEVTRLFAIFGLATFPDGEKKVVVAGGWDNDAGIKIASTEIFSFTDMTWRPGPNLPTAHTYARTVQFEDTFLAVGGNDANNRLSKKIYKFEPSSESWIELVERLPLARSFPATFFVPSDFIQCN
jgi:hypothetical protein